MPNRSVQLELDPKVSVVPDQYTALSNGAQVDLAGCDAALVVLDTGAFGGTTPAATFTVQEAPDNAGAPGAWTAVADTDLIGVVGNAAGVALVASSVAKVSYIGVQRWLRVVLNAPTGTTPVIRFAAEVVRAHLRRGGSQPV